MLLSALLLTACTTTQTITKTEFVYVTPPKAYVQTYETPKLRGKKNRDLLIWALDMKEVLKLHNEDKKALQNWIETVEEDEE